MLHQNASRNERAVTFGPAGRVGVSAVLFVPVAFGVYFSVFFLAAAAVWLLVLPVALHQLWQPVSVESDSAWPVPTPKPIEAPRASDTARV